MRPSLFSAALVAALVGYGSTIALVLAAAAALDATPAQTASWVMAVCFAKAIGSALLSTWHRVPVVLAWSTPGAALIAAAEHGLPIYEYAPKEIKQAAVGRGAAQKEQVAFMIRSMLRLRETPPPDAADALAVAITHFQNAASMRAMDREARRV